MFGHFTYLAYTLLFTVPLLALLWRHHGARLWQARRLIAIATTLVTLFGWVLWPYGLLWKCWGYSPDKILGITLFGTVLEDVVWWFCIALLFACTIALLAQFEDEGKPLMTTLLKRA